MATKQVNDLDLMRWKSYNHLRTDSLWLLGERNPSDGQGGEYHGLFHPEIPRQMIERYTRRGEWVLDPCIGSGTTGVEAAYLGRSCLGLDLNPQVVLKTQARMQAAADKSGTTQVCVCGDATDEFFWGLVRAGVTERKQGPLFQFLMLHPPYHDIVRFSDNPKDLSRCASLDVFLEKLGTLINNAALLLDPERYGALVMGDIYENGEVVPLGMECMDLLRRAKLRIKGIITKDFGETRGKSGQHALWRFRSLKNGTFRFAHEYVIVFQKRGQHGS